MPGFLVQRTPFVSHDRKTVYFARVQNNPAVDFLYAFVDTGFALWTLWSVPVAFATPVSHGIGPDGSVYAVAPGDEFVRLDPITGAVTATAGTLSPLSSPRVAVDARGTVYLGNGWAGSPTTNGRLWAFGGSLGAPLFTIVLDNPNQGGPALAEDGTLLACDRAAVRAWRPGGGPQTYCTSKVNSDGCAPPVYALGTPSASAGSGFQVGAWQIVAGNNGLFFYSTVGPAGLPFQGGLPVRRAADRAHARPGLRRGRYLRRELPPGLQRPCLERRGPGALGRGRGLGAVLEPGSPQPERDPSHERDPLHPGALIEARRRPRSAART
jgi:hypothetical protein